MFRAAMALAVAAILLRIMLQKPPRRL